MPASTKWLPIIAGLLSAGPASAQSVSFGVTGGVPVSPDSVTYGDVLMDTRPPQSGPNDLYTKPYTVGPALDINLPWRFSFATGALYNRIHRDVTTGMMAGHGQPESFGHRQDLAANAWDFPLLLKYRFVARRFTPYVGAGATLRHQSDYSGQGFQVNFFLHADPATFQVPADHNPQVALTALAGMRYHYRWLNISLEIRFLRWTALADQPAQNQVMFLTTVSFP